MNNTKPKELNLAEEFRRRVDSFGSEGGDTLDGALAIVDFIADHSDVIIDALQRLHSIPPKSVLDVRHYGCNCEGSRLDHRCAMLSDIECKCSDCQREEGES